MCVCVSIYMFVYICLYMSLIYEYGIDHVVRDSKTRRLIYGYQKLSYTLVYNGTGKEDIGI